MKRQAEFLVSKRDGRREWLRATKLARSVHDALAAIGIDDRSVSLDIATQVVGRLRQQRGMDDLQTSQVGTMVQEELVRRGFSLAALFYAEVGQRKRGREVVSTDLEARGVTPFWSDERLFGAS